MIKKMLCPVHKEGWFIIFIFASATLILWHLTTFLGIIGCVLTAWCVYFFRDPARVTPQKSDLIISPADGKLLPIQTVMPPKELGLPAEEHIKLSIFMNVFNVHVNRIPHSGTITHVKYHEGKFFNASLDKASLDNERKAFLLETPEGTKIGFVQIAGLVARRIKSDVQVGDHVTVGERFGIIRFGSRVDVYLPKDTYVTVVEGQTTVAGETILAHLTEKAPAMQGVES